MGDACLKLSYFPDCWKTAVVIPIIKPGKRKDDVNSYRPISLLSSISKLLEKIIKEQLDSHLTAHKILPDFQFGFRPLHNTNHQVLRIKNHVKEKFNSKESTALVLLDIEKAFDTVWHDALIHKLLKLNFPLATVKIVHSFLSGRKFFVKVQNDKSSEQNIPYGIPQGTVLGPTLFNIFVSDLPNLGNSIGIAMFADDTAIFTSGTYYMDVYRSLQRSLSLIENYFFKWKIKVNPQKTQAIWFTRRRKSCFFPNNVQLRMGTVDIEWSEHCRYLGIMLDKKFSFQKHVSTTINKINIYVKILYPLICRNSKLSKDNKIILFKSFFQSILLYGAPVWCDCAKTHKLKLQVCQNKILKMMLNLPWCYSTRRLHNQSNVNLLNILIEKSSNKFYENCSFSDNKLIKCLSPP